MNTLATSLNRIRRRWLLAAGLRAAARAMMAVAFINAAAALTARWLEPGDGALLMLQGLAIVLSLAAVIFFVRPLRHAPDDRQVARYIEERCPDMDDALVTAVDAHAKGTADRAFAPLVVNAAIRRLDALDLSGVCDPRDLRSASWLAAAGGAVLLFAVVLAAPMSQKAFQVALLRLFPGSVTIDVRSGDMRIPAGKPVRIVASVVGKHGTLTRIAPSVTLQSAEGQTASLPMTAADDGYELRIGALDRSFKYTVTAGPAVSSTYAVTALFPPRVQRIELHYTYPSFSGLQPREERDGGDVYAPAGTRVRMVVHTDKPVVNGALAFGDGASAVTLSRRSDRALESTLTVKDEAAYRVGLVDADGLRSEGTEYFVRVMDDRPPDVHILRPSGDQGVTSLEEVPIEARADDDFGIASFDMVYSVSGGPEQTVPFTSLGGTPTARIGSRMIALEDLRVKPGDVVAYYARARDVSRAKRSTLSRSEIFFLEVKPFNEEFSLAQSQAMAASTGTQLEGLISAQKEIISATWNLERRSAAGRSAADIKGVADAQAELKARAEQAAGQNRQRRRIGQEFPQQTAAPPQPGAQAARPPSSGDPVRDAVNAMERALQQLTTQKTADAIPHEMAALNALLQAQAEIRRRQITQGGSGGGNGNRQMQDLSNLFDRELKRQQKTNYESKAQVETQPDRQEQGSSALDKIRDLARRQEELSRRQKDLAASNADAEEKKRQLERLTREQEELAREAQEAQRAQSEQRAQRGQQQSSQSSQSSQGGRSGERNQAGQSGQQDLDRAVEQMREAAAQAKAGDAGAAAAKGEEAARQLRRAESQIQNGSPDARRRTLGDLQLESQQIAEAQQRIADEAARLEREGGGTADARRRLAGEKDRLADRVDALGASARRLADAKDTKDTTKDTKELSEAAAEAARDLSSQQIGQRMRAGANSLRAGKDTKDTT